ncbi:MAG: hypothetical protein EDM74_03375 [Armatimonadetes bacterium]|nr:MAG: hypothetical protein EDM74_03375 [Armatimonadota bacterium]
MNLSNNTARALGFDKLAPVALLGVVGLGVLCGVAFASDKATFLQSYLMGWLFWMLLAIGCLGFTLLHHTIRAAWSLSILRLLEAGSSPMMFAALAIAFVPIAANTHTLYEWTHTAFMQSHPALQYKLWFLNETGWFVRTAVYFLIFFGMSAILRKSSHEQDRTGETRLAEGRTTLSAPGLVVFVLTVTLATTDWVMSLDPHWFSHIFGAWLMVGGALTAVAVMNWIVCRNALRAPFAEIVNKGLTKDLGNMMFVFTLLWAYTSLSQFLIIWSGNLPEFITYYVSRTKMGWDTMGLVLIAGQFLAPFLLLMAPRTKAVPRLLMLMASWILLMRVVDVFWIVAPFFRKNGVEVVWTDFAAFGFMGCLWLFVFARSALQGSLIPTHDPRVKEAYHHA